MTTPRKKFPDHVTWALELAEKHHARIDFLMEQIDEVMTSRQGINKWALEALLAKVRESVAVMGQAFNSIERREPEPMNGNGAGPAVDRHWLEAMRRLSSMSLDERNAEAQQAFIDAKLAEMKA